jgi:hypothetical protein
MQLPLVDPANLSRLIQFFDIVAAVVFVVSGALVASAISSHRASHVTGCFCGSMPLAWRW